MKNGFIFQEPQLQSQKNKNPVQMDTLIKK